MDGHSRTHQQKQEMKLFLKWKKHLLEISFFTSFMRSKEDWYNRISEKNEKIKGSSP